MHHAVVRVSYFPRIANGFALSGLQCTNSQHGIEEMRLRVNIFKDMYIVRKRVTTLAGQTVSLGEVIKKVQK